jgi:hypothetical protein
LTIWARKPRCDDIPKDVVSTTLSSSPHILISRATVTYTVICNFASSERIPDCSLPSSESSHEGEKAAGRHKILYRHGTLEKHSVLVNTDREVEHKICQYLEERMRKSFGDTWLKS